MHPIAQLLPMLALLAYAAGTDLRSRRIPNWLNAVLVVTGVANSFFAGSIVSPWQSIAGLAVGFTIGLVLFVLSALTGGDVKLLAGVGAWMGTVLLLESMAAAAVAGMIIVLVQSLRQGRLLTLLRSSAVLSLSLVTADASGVQAVVQTDRKNFASRTLPYAVAMFVGTALVAVLLSML